MSDDVTNATAEVDGVLARTGLPVSEEERQRLIRLYSALQETLAGVRLPETRYAEPALIYPATFER